MLDLPGGFVGRQLRRSDLDDSTRLGIRSDDDFAKGKRGARLLSFLN